MRLSDAGLHQRQTKAVYPDHLFPPWPNEDAAPRSLEPIVRLHAAVQRLDVVQLSPTRLVTAASL